MSLQTDIGAIEAAAILVEAQVFGETVSITHRSGSSATLYALVKPLGTARFREGRTTSEMRRIEVRLPVQSGFAYPTGDTEPIIDGDMITWRGRNHVVLPPIVMESDGHVYVIEAQEEKPISTGPNG